VNAKSLREWLSSWGAGPNWSDASGETVPIVKASLLTLLHEHDRMVDALEEIRTYALDHMGDVSPAWRASLATIAEKGLSK